jgi:hypothetical protein
MSLVERRGGEDGLVVEHRGGEDGLVVGISSRSSSGSTTGIEYVGGFVRAGGLLGFYVGLGRRSCMGTCGAVGAVACIVAGLVNTLVGVERRVDCLFGTLLEGF